MGANLNRLMQAYGVYTPTVSAYSGVANPDAPKAGATAAERGTYQGSLADYTAQQDAFKQYEQDYKNRIATTDLYTSPRTASTFLSTPNYSAITGMRANLSDTTSADTTDYTNPNFSSMINDAYRSLGRVGIGTDTSNIDQPGYNYWMGQLQAGANGGIAPSNFKNQFKTSTNDYIRQYPNNDYTKYIKGYLGLLPATTLPTTGVDGNSGDTGDTGDTDWNNSGWLRLLYRGGTVKSPKSMEDALLRDRSRHEFSDPSFEETYGKYFYEHGGAVDAHSLGIFDDGPSSGRARGGLGETLGNPYNLLLQSDSQGNPTIQPGVIAPYTATSTRVDTGNFSEYDPLHTTDMGSIPFTAPAPAPGAAASTGVDTTSGFYDPNTNLGNAANPARAQNSQTVSDIIKRNRDAVDAYRKSLVEPSSRETGPSEAERWFRLASAMFGSTSGKGAFWRAAGEYAEKTNKANQEATLRKNAAEDKRRERELKGLELDYKITHDEVIAARQDLAEQNKADLLIRLKNMDLSKPNDRERRIRDIMQSQNVPYSVAAAFVDRTVVMGTDPVTGQPIQINAIRGQQVPTDTGAGAAPAPAPAAASPREATAWELASTPFTTGVGPKLREVVQSVTGQVGWNTVSSEFTKRRQELLNMQNQVIRTVINNPRFPVSEQERIRKEINIYPSISTDPQTLLANIRSLDSTLRTMLANREREGNDINLPVTGRQEAILAANEARNLLKILGVPQRDASGAPSGQNNIPPVPKGVPENLWRAMTPGERELWQN